VTDAEWLEQTLERVVERVGDPVPLVYERLFGSAPELRAMFVMDTQGSVRGEMFQRALETLPDLAHGRPYAHSLIAS
jgi:hemoglobin-like flavoprotein